MHIVMVKKLLENGEPCRKCLRTQDLLERRGLWHRIDEVVLAIEGQPDAPGWALARQHQVETAPFFVVRDDAGEETVYTSALVLIREQLTESGSQARASKRQTAGQESVSDLDLEEVARDLSAAPPSEVVGWALAHFGSECAIAFSGAEDVALIDMAMKSGHPFSVISLDTGRLHPETYEFVERVREHYGIDIEVVSPEASAVQTLVRQKGLFSFYRDGHGECCGVRKVAPLTRVLRGYRAWITGQRRDQSATTRADLPVVQWDGRFQGASGPLVKLNPLATWTSAQTWTYLRTHQVPHNQLHERGFVSIGCAPCTRPVLPGQHEREGRWWWEQEASKECGLHVPGAGAQSGES